MRNSIFVIAVVATLATTGLALAERAHVEQRPAAGGGHQSQKAYTDQPANGKVADSAPAKLEQLGIGPDQGSTGSVGRVRRAATPPNHVDYDLPLESVAGSSEP
jgi:hypothetical protein